MTKALRSKRREVFFVYFRQLKNRLCCCYIKTLPRCNPVIFLFICITMDLLSCLDALYNQINAVISFFISRLHFKKEKSIFHVRLVPYRWLH